MIQVIKATGEKEDFSEEKVKNSIARAGIPSELETDVINNIKNKLYDNIPTSEIYKHITDTLENSSYPYSKAKYGLKQSLMSLGPTGYPFEDFIAGILKDEGYSTEVRSIVNGKCITHEIDIIAQKDNIKIMIEAKFHNTFGIRTDVHDALYTKARFDDVKDRNGFSEAWLITNTKATIDTIAYCNCVGMKIISWSYPNDNNLRSMIKKNKACLITSLSTLTQAQKQQLLENHAVMCKDVYNNPQILNPLGIEEETKKKIVAEAEFVNEN